jgi:hypothetical protein
MKANSYVAARASGVASLFLPIRPPSSGTGAGSADYQTMGGETYTYLNMISKYLREGIRELLYALLRYGTLARSSSHEILCTGAFLYVRYSFLLISNKFCDLS